MQSGDPASFANAFNGPLMLSSIAAPPAQAPDFERARATTFVQDRITGIILASFFTVHRELGPGFADQVYKRALVLELQQRGLRLEQELFIGVFYKGAKVGQYTADLMVEGRVIVQIRTGAVPAEWEGGQLVRQLRRTACPAAMLLIFGVTPVFRHLTSDECPPEHS